MKYETFIDNPYYVNSSYWKVFVDPIASGGPEPMFLEYKSVESLMNNMIQGIVMGEGSAAELVATAAAEMKAREQDLSLATTLDTLRATGASAGGATALAQAASRSKANI